MHPTTSGPNDPADPGGTSATTSSGRLRPGELQRMVAAALARRAGADASVGDILADFPGRSSGAINNALKWLVRNGHAEKTNDTPKRYRATSTISEAARTRPRPQCAPATAPPAAAAEETEGTNEEDTAPESDAPETDAQEERAPGDGPDGRSEALGDVAEDAPPSHLVSGPVTRPGGQCYHPRILADGLPDVTVLRRLRDAGIPVILSGPPGTGKTSLAEAAFPDLITLQGDSDTTVGDIIGEYTQSPDGTYPFAYGPLVQAMREGRPLFIDDATLVAPTVLAVLYPAMDGRGEIVIKAHAGETVTAEPGFYVIAGHNPGVHGAILTDALASRFSVSVQVSTDYTLAEKQLGVDARVVAIARLMAEAVEAGTAGWAPQLRELIAHRKVAAVLGEDAAARNLIGAAPEEDRALVASHVRRAFPGCSGDPLSLGARLS